MTFTEFIFSRKRSILLLRHIVFWSIWITFFSIQTLLTRIGTTPFGQNTGASFSEVGLSTIIDMYYCYFIIYYLIPKLYFKGYFARFFLFWLLHNLLVFFLFRVFRVFASPFIYAHFNVPLRPLSPFYLSFFWLFSAIGFEGCMAAAIVLGKLWYKSNQNFLRLAKEQKSIKKTLEEKEHTILPFPTLQTILYNQRPERVKASVIPHGLYEFSKQPDLALRLIEDIIVHAQQAGILVQEELKTLQNYWQLKGQDFACFPFLEPQYAGEYSITPNLLLTLASLPFLNENDINKEKELLLNVAVAGGELVFKMQWHKKNVFEVLTAPQYETLKQVKGIVKLKNPRDNNLSIEIKHDHVYLQLRLHLNQHI